MEGTMVFAAGKLVSRYPLDLKRFLEATEIKRKRIRREPKHGDMEVIRRGCEFIIRPVQERSES